MRFKHVVCHLQMHCSCLGRAADGSDGSDGSDEAGPAPPDHWQMCSARDFPQKVLIFLCLEKVHFKSVEMH